MNFKRMTRAGVVIKPTLEDMMRIQFILLFCLSLGITSAQSQGAQPKQVDTKVYSKNPEANALYIRGQEYLKNADARAGGTMENAHKALDLFRQATKKDPRFALAYIGQADALNWFALNVAGAVSPVEVYRQQEAAALKAVAIDDTLIEAHIHLAAVYYDNAYDWPKTEKELKRILELAPNHISAICRYARLFGILGKFEEAEALAKKAQAIDPNNPVPNRALLRIYYWEHKDEAAYEQAMEALKKDKDDRPTHYFLSFVYYHQGKYDQGIEESKLGSFGDADSLAGLAYGYALAGYKKELKEALEQFDHHGGRNQALYGLAQVYVAMGDKDRAIELIAKDYDRHSSRMNWLKIDPTLDPLRDDPRFKQLIHKMNLD